MPSREERAPFLPKHVKHSEGDINDGFEHLSFWNNTFYLYGNTETSVRAAMVYKEKWTARWCWRFFVKDLTSPRVRICCFLQDVPRWENMSPSSFLLHLPLMKSVTPLSLYPQETASKSPQGLPTGPLWQAWEENLWWCPTLYKRIEIGLPQVAESLQKLLCLTKRSFFSP